jgi:putative ABC transport system permease protein
VKLQSTLSDGGRGGMVSAGRHRVRRTLVVCEIALSVVLLIGAGLLIRSLFSLQQVTPGFNPESMMTMRIALPAAKYKTDGSIVTFTDRLLEKMKSIPGVTSAAIVNPLPFSGEGW